MDSRRGWTIQRVNGWKSCHMFFGHIELPQTTPHRSTRETPFSMTYGAEIVIPLETRFLTLRTSIRFGKQWQPTRKEPRPSWRTKRKCHASISMLSAEAQVGVWLKSEIETVSTRRLSVKKGCGYCKKPNIGKIRAQLERFIPYYLGS